MGGISVLMCLSVQQNDGDRPKLVVGRPRKGDSTSLTRDYNDSSDRDKAE